MKIRTCSTVAAITLAGTAALQAVEVFSDTFDYGTLNAFTSAPPAGGGWTAEVPGGTLGSNFGTSVGSVMWGNPTGGGNTAAGVEYNHPTVLAAGETITMDANITRVPGYLYGMRVILWDGSDAGTRTEVAGGTQSPTSVGALTQVSYTVTPADITAGLDHVIFQYSHDGNWGETDNVSFAVDAVPSGFTWTNTAGGSWATPGDWTPAGPATGADQAALINTLDITGDQTITLDGSYTIGTVRFSDTAGDDGNWILNPGSGGTLTLSAPVDGSPGVIVSNQTATVNTVLTGTEGMTKTGAGTLVLGAANTYTGGTFVDVGTVQIGNASAIPSGAGAGDVSLVGTLDLNDTSITLNGLTGGGPVTNSGSGTPTLTIGGDDADGLTYSGAIGDGGGGGTTSLIKTGTGTATLTGVHGMSGTVTGDGGTLVLNAFQSLFNVSGITVNTNATVELDGQNMFVGGHGVALDDTRVLSADGGNLYMGVNTDSRIGNVNLANGAIWTIDRGLGAWDVLLADTTAGAATVTVANTAGTDASLIDGFGGLHLQGAQNFDVDDVTGDSAADLEISITLAGPGNTGGTTGGLNKLGAGTLLLSGFNSYTGDTTVAVGTVVLDPFGVLTFAIGANGVNNKVTGAGTAELNGAFDLDLSGADTTTGNTWTLVDATSHSFDMGTFELFGFTESPEGIHTMVDGPSTWVFTESTGVLEVTTVVNDYDSWAATFLPEDVSDPGGDNDNDGLTNEKEYQFALDPTSGSSVNPISSQLDKTTGTFSYTRRDPALTGLTYTYEWSTSLSGWTAVVPAVADGVVQNGDNQTVTVDLTGAPGDPLANDALFVRVVAAP